MSGVSAASGDGPPRIEFPCAYPIKVLGTNEGEFEEAVVALIRRHAPDLDPRAVSTRSSRNGNYLAITVTVIATGEPQLRRIHAELNADTRVKMVL